MMQTFTGKDYLKIDIANNFGHDQMEWDDRIIWFNENEENLDKLTKQAEKPALFFAGVQAWHKAVRGEPSSYPISLDATASGIQLLAALTGDRKAAMACNLVDTGERADAYTALYQCMLDKIGDVSKIERKGTKQAIMTAFYSSTAVPKRIFGEGELLNIFYDTMKENAPGAWELTETMLAIWDEDKYSNDWIMPDNFHIKIKVMGTSTDYIQFLNEPFEVPYSENKPIKNGRSLGANMTHGCDGMVVREMERRCHYDNTNMRRVRDIIENSSVELNTGNMMTDRDKMVQTLWEHYIDSGFLSMRILNYIDNGNIGLINRKVLNDTIMTLPFKPFEVLSVHDCFRCLPNYANDLRKQYNQIMSEIAKSDLLKFIISQLLGRIVPVTKLNPDLWKDILDANYALS